MSKIEKHTRIEPVPARKITSYETTDGRLFDSYYKASNHQKYIDAKEHVATLPTYYDWTLCRNMADFIALFHEKSEGRYTPVSTELFPQLVALEDVYQDKYNRWIVEMQSLRPGDLAGLQALLDAPTSAPTGVNTHAQD